MSRLRPRVSLNGLPTKGLTLLLPETPSDKAMWASIQNKVTGAKDDVPPPLEKPRSLQLGEFLVIGVIKGNARSLDYGSYDCVQAVVGLRKSVTWLLWGSLEYIEKGVICTIV